MHTRRINENIREKLNSWIKTLPEDLRDETRKSVFVSGGCIVSMLLNEDVNDYDVYFTDKGVARKVLEHYLTMLKAKGENDKVSRVEVQDYQEGLRVYVKSAGALDDRGTVESYDYFEGRSEEATLNYTHELFKKDARKKYHPVLVTSNALSLTDDIQLITRFIGPPEVVHKFFDYIHCTCYFTFAGGVVTNKEALESIVTKHLKYFGSKYPVAAMFRMRKYLQRGWNINAGQMFKVAYDINQLNLNDHAVLTDQLIGVDQAYFHEVLSKLKNSEEIDRTYLFSLIEGSFEE